MTRLATKQKRQIVELFASGKDVYWVATKFGLPILDIESVIRAAMTQKRKS